VINLNDLETDINKECREENKVEGDDEMAIRKKRKGVRRVKPKRRKR